MDGYKDGIPKGKDRLFEKMFHIGNGKHSTKRMDVLLCRVEEALHALGAIQQPPMATSVPEEQEDQEVRERLTQFIEGVVEDVAMALTGQEWIRSEESPPKFSLILELKPGEVAYTKSTTMTTNSHCYSAPYGPFNCKIVATKTGWEWVK